LIPYALRAINLVAALVVAAGLYYVGANGAGPLPPLGPAFNPGTGVWTAATDARPPHNETPRLAGLDKQAGVTLERNGTAHIAAATDHDLFFALGYLHARYRLFQMDLLRRQGEGLLSEAVGPAALASDRFELRLGLLRTAQAEWRAMAPNSAARRTLAAYAAGVNARLREDVRAGALPLLFKMLGYAPKPWTEIDTLVVQGDMVQTLDFTDSPLDYALLAHYLGAARAAAWFPVLPPDAQQPYDPGPYIKRAAAPIAPQGVLDASALRAVASLKGQLATLPPGALHHGGNSNNWAVDGTKTTSGKPLLAGDPHLHLTLPSIWYQVEATSPGYSFSGVSIPGTPVILIGHNRHIAWSLTNVQNQATLYYLEKTDAARPRQYYWRGAWRPMARVSYSIPVKGQGTVHLDVDLTVHGPVISDDRAKGRTIAVDWMGALPSPDLDVMRDIARAADFHAFRAALRAWHAPSQNFVYADDKGHIGLVSAGYYPIVKSGQPWLPLPGTGEADVVGTIPFDDIPRVYDPPGHIVWSANQRPVGPAYPYYIGTTMNFFDNGYRADRIHQVLQQGKKLTAGDMERLQNDTHDYLAGLIVPKLLAVLDRTRLSGRERQARDLLRSWDGNMSATSPGAAIWWGFWWHYVHAAFDPWWDYYHVPYKTFASLAVDYNQPALDENLETWTLHDQQNGAFSLPNGQRRTAADVMAQAYRESIAAWTRTLGGNPRGWRWGDWHTRRFDSLAQIPSLQYGPRGSGGDDWTVDAADGEHIATAGPSWRFVMDWGAGGTGTGVGVYPGGQSENPLSPWYEDGVSTWWDGRYNPMLDGAAARAQQSSATWRLTP